MKKYILKYFSISIKDKNSLALIIPINLLLIVVGYTIGHFFQYFSMNRTEAYDLLKEIFSHYISLLGVGLAIIAILFAVIQLAYKKLNVVEVVIKNTYFAPLFYFGIFNALLCSSTILFYPNDKIDNFISDDFFIGFTVIENYLFDLFLVLLSIVFYKTFTYVNFSRIIDLYLKDVKKKLKNETKSKLNDSSNDNLQIYSNEMNAEIVSSINENRLIAVVKIFDLYNYSINLNSGSSLLNGYKWNLADWFYLSSNQENTDLFYTIIENWRKQYYLLINSDVPDRLVTISGLPTILYNKGVLKQNDQFIKKVVQSFPIRLQEMAKSFIYNSVDENGNVDKEQFKKSHFPIKEFNSLIRTLCDKLDLFGLNETLQWLKRIKNASTVNDNYTNIRFAIELKESVSEQKLQELVIYEDFYNLIFAIEFGNFCWTCFKLFNYEKDIPGYLPIIDAFDRYSSIDVPTLIEYIQKITNWQRQLDWNIWIWNAEERLDGETYYLESESTFIALGFIIKLSRIGIKEVDLPNTIIENIDQLVYSSKEVMEKFKNEKRIWKYLLNISNDHDLEIHFANIKTFLNGLSTKREKLKRGILISEPISAEKVQDFKDLIKSQWRKSRTIEDIFEHYNNQVINPTEELKRIGIGRKNFQHAKFMFVEKNYQEIYGIEWGHQVNDQVSNYFIEKIVSNPDVIKLQAENFSTALDIIYNSNKNINIVFIGYEAWANMGNDLSISGNYIKGNELQSRYTFKIAGIYKENLIIVPLQRNSLIQKSLVGISFPEAIRLKRRENPKWVDNKLQVDIQEIDQDKARELLKQSNPEADENNIDLLNEIMDGILIEINEIIDFEIIEPKKIIVVDVKKI